MVDVGRLPVGEDNTVTLDYLAREGARRMIAAALKGEVEEYVASFVDEVDEDGKRLVVRHGRARARRLTIGSGTVPIRAPRINDKRIDEETGERAERWPAAGGCHERCATARSPRSPGPAPGDFAGNVSSSRHKQRGAQALSAPPRVEIRRARPGDFAGSVRRCSA